MLEYKLLSVYIFPNYSDLKTLYTVLPRLMLIFVAKVTIDILFLGITFFFFFYMHNNFLAIDNNL